MKLNDCRINNLVATRKVSMTWMLPSSAVSKVVPGTGFICMTAKVLQAILYNIK